MKKTTNLLWKRVLLWAALGLLAVSTTGCFLRLLLGREVVETLSEEIDLIISALSANATTAVCRVSGFTGLVECTYLIEDPGGTLSEITSTSHLVSEFGLFGVFVDPVVLELPAGVTGITGTYTDGGVNTGDLLVYPNLSYIPVDDSRTLTPGPGKQLAIVDFPADIPLDGVDYQMSLSFQQLVPKGTPPTPIRALFTGKVRAGTKTYYPPMLPCTSDIASLPTLTLPRSATLQPLAIPAGLEGCDNELYTFFQFPRSCDLDNDQDVDRNDIALVMAMRNRSADPGDPRDLNGNGKIDANDARRCTLQCNRPRCS
ncbi:MAG: hypothetical protein ACRD3V_32945 [Vicinamibacteria bacterium]